MLLIQLLAGGALAWEQADDPWETLPIDWYLGGICDAELPEGYCGEATERAFALWDEAVPCSDLGGRYAGRAEANGWDDRITIGFGDPGDELEPGVIAASVENQVTVDGEPVLRDYDLVFNDDVDWLTHEQAVAGGCGEALDLLAVVAHELGHLYGLGHSCSGAACDDPLLGSALMSSDDLDCGSEPVPNADDVAGMTALYGPRLALACLPEPSGPPPLVGGPSLELACAVAPRDTLSPPAAASWTFGDGGTAEGIAVRHVYERAGRYTIAVEAAGTAPVCATSDDPSGAWVTTAVLPDHVLLCDAPAPVFTAERVDGLAWQLRNETPIDLAGCLTSIRWQVFRGDEALGEPVVAAEAWEPEVTLPEAGTYTVVLHVGGPGGVGAATATLRAGGGCGGGRALLVLPLLGLAIRRRRRGLR